MPDEKPKYPDPREEDIMAGDRRISRPDSSLPDWEMPDTSYRPIPIVWFTGAFFLHLIVAMAVLFILSSQGPLLSIALCALAAGAIGNWTWDRGMKSASLGWKIATVIMLMFNMLFVTASVFAS